jgi:preprotein translocase subunit SecY
MGVLDILHSLAGFLPEIKAPEKPLGSKERLMWTGLALVLYFLMYQTTAFGVPHMTGGIDFLQTITASRIGSLLTTGIGPIVLASIFLQLFVGAGLLNLNLKDKKDKAKFLETQKILAIGLALVEALVFVIFSGIVPVQPVFGFLGEGTMTDAVTGASTVYAPYTMALVVLQITLGSVLVLFLDELVTKYGIGSGISLFIAAGVSLAVIMGLCRLCRIGKGRDSDSVRARARHGAQAAAQVLLCLQHTRHLRKRPHNQPPALLGRDTHGAVLRRGRTAHGARIQPRRVARLLIRPGRHRAAYRLCQPGPPAFRRPPLPFHAGYRRGRARHA